MATGKLENGSSMGKKDNRTGVVTNSCGSESADRIYVGGLSWQTTEKTLRTYFSQFGVVTSVSVVMEPNMQRSRGFGFVSFMDSSTVPRVLAMKNLTLDGRKIEAKPSIQRTTLAAQKKGNKLFIGGVSQQTTVEDIKIFFSQFGKIAAAVLLINKMTNRHRGCGFLTFESVDVAEKVCEIRYHVIKCRTVECKQAHQNEPCQSLNLQTKDFPFTYSPQHTVWYTGQALRPLPDRKLKASHRGALVRQRHRNIGAGCSIWPGLPPEINYHSPGHHTSRQSPYPLPNLNAANSNANSLPNLTGIPYGTSAFNFPPPAETLSFDISSINWAEFYNYHPYPYA